MSLQTSIPKLTRLKDMEGENVKFALSNNDASIMATMVYLPKFKDKMEIRITSGNNRSYIRGDKSIMDNIPFNKFHKKVEDQIKWGCK